MIESTIIGFPSDIIKEILNYLHKFIFVEIGYYESHDHTYDKVEHEMDNVDEYRLNIAFDPTFARSYYYDANDKSIPPRFTLARNWGRSTYTFTLKANFDANLFKSEFQCLCDDFEVDQTQYEALISFLRRYYSSL